MFVLLTPFARSLSYLSGGVFLCSALALLCALRQALSTDTLFPRPLELYCVTTNKENQVLHTLNHGKIIDDESQK